MCFVIFSVTFAWKIYYSRRIQRDVWNLERSSWKMPVIHVRFLIKLEFSRYVLKKHSNIKFHVNPSSGSRVVACGRTGGHRQSHRHTRRSWQTIFAIFRTRLNIGQVIQSCNRRLVDKTHKTQCCHQPTSFRLTEVTVINLLLSVLLKSLSSAYFFPSYWSHRHQPTSFRLTEVKVG
jgi:hypothetical protein